ncbi:hypothetical protein CF386_10405 [Paraphotobacterium marinum]|uniref:LPP20 family lipoprotein n=1 Tax=Paraphotobacterium marinum TaxID=1755811 RepID=A0A220VH08_9GAMM|nr:hypothetical protein [Paraphotobacterium marinum]ASK79462.1 hypothetical protein CF386_10405 [Paraphotobacterium marinum]
MSWINTSSILLFLFFVSGCTSTEDTRPQKISHTYQYYGYPDSPNNNYTNKTTNNKIDYQPAPNRNNALNTDQEFNNDIPKWVTTKHQPTSEAIYAVGMGESKQLRIALEESQDNAQIKLRQKISKVINYTSDDLNQNSSQSASNYEIVKKEIVEIDGIYHAFVLAELKIKDINNSLRANNSQILNEDRSKPSLNNTPQLEVYSNDRIIPLDADEPIVDEFDNVDSDLFISEFDSVS